MTLAAAPPWSQNVTEIVDRAAAVMRLDPSDPDVVLRLPLAAEVACELINDYLDRGPAIFTSDDVPEAVMGAATQTTIELYRRKDAPFGVVSGWSQIDNQYGVTRPSTDWIKGVETQLAPFKLAWGIG